MVREKKKTVLLLGTVGAICIVIVVYFQFFCYQVVEEDWGDETVSEGSPFGYKLNNLFSGDILYVRCRSDTTVSVGICTINEWDEWQEEGKGEPNLLRSQSSSWREDFEYVVRDDDSYVIVIDTLFSSATAKTYYKVSRYPYRWFVLPLLFFGLSSLLSGIVYFWHERHELPTCPDCRTELVWYPDAKRWYCPRCRGWVMVSRQ